MLQAKELNYRIGPRLLFSDVSFSIPPEAKVGIVGPNGVGKTTLFRIILGEIVPDGGEILYPGGYRFVQVRQEMGDGRQSPLELVLASDRELALVREQLEGPERDGMELAELWDQFLALGGQDSEARAASILAGLGFSEESMRQPLQSLSGGWRVRAALASTLFAPSDCLLLDEPTNHLDFETALWLEQYLRRTDKSLCIISHEKKFLNSVCDHILHLQDAGAQLYRGNYDTFRSTEANVRRAREMEGIALQRKREHLQSFVDRFRAKASKAKQAQSRLKMLEKLEEPPPPPANYEVAFHFPVPAPKVDRRLVSLENVALGYGDRIVLRAVNLQINAGDRIALLGANGNGKSTLAKAVAGQLAPLSGERIFAKSLKIAYFAQQLEEALDLQKTPVEAFRQQSPGQTETQIRSQLARFGIGQGRALTQTAHLSGGEKTRLLLAMATLPQPHLLVLDEPTNHLDIEARTALAEAIRSYEGAVLLVTHDFQTLADSCRDFYVVDGGCCQKFNGSLQEYARWLLDRSNGPQKESPKGAAQRQKKGKGDPDRRMEELTARLEEKTAALKKIEEELATNYSESGCRALLAVQEEVNRLESAILELVEGG
ncbi:MAG: ATP-binding cassette domain-containing protein [Puniceicoccales bacterium]|jgi:ATP-binding cassette subfamily F protein 3|nr:ATP-binding cassette domain-containing protein [Puniceicoccales bacterium]